MSARLRRAARFVSDGFYFTWLSVSAHAHAAWHALQGHDVRFFEGVDLWYGFLGGVACETCSLGIWGRDSRILRWLGQSLCGWKGHGPVGYWQDPVTEQPLKDRPCCDRCLTDLPVAA